MALAFINVVIDAIIIVQSRKDPQHGSQNLMSVAWMAMGVGGVIGCMGGGFLTQYSHPRYAFLAASGMGLIIALIGTCLTKEAEQNEAGIENSEADNVGFWSNLKANLYQISLAIRMPEIYCVICFFVLNGLFSPSFG